MQTVDPAGTRVPKLGERIALAIDRLTLRFVRSTDFPRERDTELVELLGRAFNGGPSGFDLGVDPLDHLRWKLRDCPGGALLELTEDRDTVVGMHIYHQHRYLSRGEELLFIQGLDLALDPAYQGQGIYSATRRLRAQLMAMSPWCRLKVSLGTYPLGGQRLGKIARSEGNQLLTLVKLISPTRLVWTRLTDRLRRSDGSGENVSRTRAVMEAQGVGGRLPRSARIRPALELLRATVTSPFRRSRSGASWTMHTIHEFDERADRFWERASEAFDVIQVRDREYLNWRFCDPRAGEFIVRTAEKDGELLGYVALRLTGTSAQIADMLALPDRSDVVRALIVDAVDIARQNGAYQIRCWSMEGHSYLEELRHAGFAVYPSMISLRFGEWSSPPPEITFFSACLMLPTSRSTSRSSPASRSRSPSARRLSRRRHHSRIATVSSSARPSSRAVVRVPWSPARGETARWAASPPASPRPSEVIPHCRSAWLASHGRSACSSPPWAPSVCRWPRPRHSDRRAISRPRRARCIRDSGGAADRLHGRARDWAPAHGSPRRRDPPHAGCRNPWLL